MSQLRQLGHSRKAWDKAAFSQRFCGVGYGIRRTRWGWASKRRKALRGSGGMLWKETVEIWKEVAWWAVNQLGFEKAAMGGLVLCFMWNTPDKEGLISHFMPSHALSEMPHSPCLGHKVPVLQAIFTPFMFIVKVLNLRWLCKWRDGRHLAWAYSVQSMCASEGVKCYLNY